MATLQEKMASYATENHELLGTLANTDHAIPALAQQRAYITDLTAELKRADAKLRKLETKRLEELRDHEKYRDSVMRRFAYKATRKAERFAEKAAKEEREYFAALQAEHQAGEERAALTASKIEAEEAAARLEPEAEQHRAAQKQLDELYERLFAGPTPAFPAEDAAEQTVQRAQEQHDATVQRQTTQRRVCSVLTSAQAALIRSQRAAVEARSASSMDMFGGGLIADMMERSALADTQREAHEAERLVQQARRMDEAVGELPGMEIASGNLMSDVFFDNIFTDMAFHEKIKESQAGLDRAAKVLEEHAQGAKLRLKQADETQKVAEVELVAAREALQKRRAEAFETIGAKA
ncbi:hypothetical protein FH972_022643 [Carpinus fangiana]|uniref:Uncharacterized protein n=1 Tax=Carpinus fangiana TaxID=176857 RepID=A0A5N6KT80_9ROSI|nr:hypothetical protein FH972_022643 [Carpinus fangiana]